MLDFYIAFSNWQNFQRISLDIDEFIETLQTDSDDVEQHLSSFLDDSTGKRFFIVKNEQVKAE